MGNKIKVTKINPTVFAGFARKVLYKGCNSETWQLSQHTDRNPTCKKLTKNRPIRDFCSKRGPKKAAEQDSDIQQKKLRNFFMPKTAVFHEREV